MLTIALVTLVSNTNASFTENKPVDNHKTLSFTDKNTGIEFLINLRRKDYEQLTGMHLTLLERIVFKWAQKRAGKKFGEEKQSKGFNPIGFFAAFLLGLIGLLGLLAGLGLLFGLLLSLIGVAGTYVFSKDRNMQKWAWIGVGAFLFAIVVLIIIVFATGSLG